MPILKNPMKTAKHILVVDDEPLVRCFLKAIFAQQGSRVTEAENASEAIARITAHEFDLVITDVNMPGLSGVELVKEIKRMQATVPVIVMTGNPDVETAVEAMRVGAAEFLGKPIRPDKILELSEALFAAQEAASEPTLILDMEAEAENRIGNYRILNLLAEGAMGAVYLVEPWHAPEGRQYAMKVLRSEIRPDSTILARFEREIQLLERLRHPNIVSVIESGVCQHRRSPYLVMEYVRGQSLKLYSRGLLPLDLSQKVAIIQQVAEALAEVHRFNICHRDVKPDNILVLPDLTPKLTDFGIAHTPMSDLTLVEQPLGTPAFMAPEAFVSADVEPAADVFSLGAVAYELFLQTRAFSGDDLVRCMMQVRESSPPAPRSLVEDFPPALEGILAKMLAKHPRDRYQGGSEVAAALAAYVSGELLSLPRAWAA